MKTGGLHWFGSEIELNNKKYKLKIKKTFEYIGYTTSKKT